MANELADDDDFSWDDDLDDPPATDLGDTGEHDDPPTPSRSELEQKIRSAEGRYQKSEEKLQEFQGSIQTMQQQLASLNENNANPDDTQDTGKEAQDVVPEGWSKEEWDDFKDDQPVTAELHEKQTRQVQEIREDLEEYRTTKEAESLQTQFRGTVLEAHPDYDDLLKNERTHIETFINEQTNPIVKSAYQHVYEQGTADEVVQLVNDYKAVRPDSGHAQSKRSKADDALAITSRSASPNVSHRGSVDPDDFEKAWDDFPDDLDD